MLVRLAAWAVAPGFAGLLMTGDTMFLPLVIGAGMKITYDILLWRAFRGIKPPEPYLGKGIAYDNEVIRRKQGKKAV